MNNENHVVEEKRGWKQLADGYLDRTPIFQFILVSLIFPLWGAAASLNDILITQFKSVFTLNDASTAFVQSAFYGGYFLIAIPASIVIKKKSYKFAIMMGLIFYILGCGMFFPASRVATYTMFLAAIFAIAVGLSFLETSCDTYSSMLGPKKHANIRLNISQTLVPLGDMAGIILGKYLIFGSVGNLSETMSHMHGAERIAYGEKMLQLTLQPYKYILFILILILLILALTPMPKSKAVSLKSQTGDQPSLLETFKYLIKNSRFKKGVMAQFIYVGMQTTVWSFTIRLALDLNHSITDSDASTFMIYSYIAWFIGKLCANFLMNRFSLTKVLTIYSALGTVTLILTTFIPSMFAVWMAICTSFFFGPEWPTIYAHTLDTVEDKRFTETAGAFIVMAIVGGAVVPAIQGVVSDLTSSMQFSFIVPTICYVMVTIYFLFEYRYDLKHPELISENS
ncbi:L-fucose:H+ symporter permease [Liquorilactobacillus nagelii]|uniref:L-fucose:H+ symporter permease n=1 Tax=Liquorilactobacillus nagelii TaxID=82688 RepID=UPI0006EE8D6B|nr:L-fucose:H+ symporter permease [Liquorilactobacillus nagelii]KRL41133.1 major facilitator superfamily MFS 1 [Liquorilactobacillus nagelii DSM 13675]QYH54061.1 L-fucose:H+ symporter permease [Liquorilactobacillus nagelii DSM 13675]